MQRGGQQTQLPLPRSHPGLTHIPSPPFAPDPHAPVASAHRGAAEGRASLHRPLCTHSGASTPHAALSTAVGGLARLAGEICPPRRHSRRRRIGSSRRSRATLHYYAPSPPASARRTTVEPDRGLHLSARALRVSLMQQLRRRDACRRHTGQGARTRT